MPKFNMYQSLHTTVIGPEGKPVEIQIRTHEMHRRAEYGVAAHWKYKDDPTTTQSAREDGGVNDMAWLRQLLDWQRETADPGEFLDSLRFEINAPGGLRLHPEGRRGRAARRARRRSTSPTPCTPRSGTAASAPGSTAGSCRWRARWTTATSSRSSPPRPRAPGPSRDWLTFVQEPAGPQQDPAVVHQGAPRGGDRARQGRHRQGDAQAGPADAAAHVARVPRRPRLGDALPRRVRAVRRGRRGARRRGHRGPAAGPLAWAARTAPRRTSPRPPRPRGRSASADRATPASSSGGPTTSGSSWPSAARRCPATRSSASSPAAAGSRCTAPTAANVDRPARRQPDRIVEVDWAPTSASVFLVQIQVEALDRSRLLSDVTRVLSDHHVNILSANVSDHPRPGRGLAGSPSRWPTPRTWATCSTAVRKVDGVFDAYRVTGRRDS